MVQEYTETASAGWNSHLLGQQMQLENMEKL